MSRLRARPCRLMDIRLVTTGPIEVHTAEMLKARAEAAETEAASLRLQLEAAGAENDRLREIERAARLVSEWHDSIGTGPIEELDAELGELHALTHPEAER